MTVIDCGILGEPGTESDLHTAVAHASGSDIAAMRGSRDRASAGLEAIQRDLQGRGQGLDTSDSAAALASATFALLPFGAPKMLATAPEMGLPRSFCLVPSTW